jgi:hypothetical protein
MCDHQIAHVYLRDPATRSAAAEALGAGGVNVLAPSDRGITHRRAGDLLLEAPADAWLDYRWWSNPDEAPAFAKTVDIHRKPGYDPLELFFDPATRGTSQASGLLKGSHGIADPGEAVYICGKSANLDGDIVAATEVPGLLTRLLTS